MDADSFREMFANPSLFREHLVIPAGRGAARFADVMADFQRQDFTRIDPALIALARGHKPEPGRFWFERTKGASKDTDSAVSLLWLLGFGRRPLACQVGAADQDQADELRKAAKDILRLNDWLAELVQVQSWVLLNGRTDARCEIIAADVAGSHGARPDLLILNELSHVTKEDFAKNLLDNASKVPHGMVLVATNAGFVPSWQFDLREMARTSPRWYFSSYTQPAPWLEDAEIDEARRRNSANRFARLWEGQWVPESGDALSTADIEAAVTLPSATLAKEEGYSYFAGLDIGIKRDHTSLVLVGLHYLTRRLKLCLVKDWKPPAGGKVNLAAVQNEARWLCHHFGCVLHIDPYQAELMGQNLESQGVGIELVPFVGKTLNEMASNLIECFADRSIDLFRCETLLDDLRRLQLKETPAGWRLVPARTASGGHGDRATALALAVLAAKRDGGGYAGPWLDSGIPQGQQRSPTQELFADHADAFGPSGLAPGWLGEFSGWPGERDRPL
jgi:hypothetical protein